MERVQSAAAHLESRIETLQSRFPQLGELRGKGLLRGIPVGPEPEKGAQLSADILQAAREEGLLLLRSGKNVLRIAPTLVITDDEIDEGMARLERALRKFEKELS
jgi:acetylornithine/N-succinyldiaminopimelate aminotransferase